MSTLRPVLGAIIAASVLASCSDPASPPSAPVAPAGDYVLLSVNDAPLPFVIADEEIYVRLVADTLHLDSDGEGMWVTHLEWRIDGGPLNPFALHAPVTYDIDDQGAMRLTVHPVCTPGEPCPEPEEIDVVREGTLLSLVARFGAHRFERVPPPGGGAD